MVEIERLITVVDLAGPDGHSAWAHLHALLATGGRFVLLDDRGWGSGAAIAGASQREVENTARMVVGPDGPGPGETPEQMESLYWLSLERKLRDAGINIGADKLQRLPHDVEISKRLRSLLAENS
jgi:hypothetical protein